MGLFSKKKREGTGATPSPSTTNSRSTTSDSASPPSNFLSLPRPTDSPAHETSSSTKPRSPSSTSSRFTNLFRSTSNTDQPAVSLPPPTSRPSFSGPLDRQHNPYDPPRVSDVGHAGGGGGGAYGRGGGASGFVRTRPGSTSRSSWDDTGIPLDQDSSRQRTQSNQLESLDRSRLFGGSQGGSNGNSGATSTTSLPLFQQEDSDRMRKMSSSTAREPSYPSTSKIDEEEQSGSNSKWSRFKLGRGQKQRTGSMSSMRVFGADNGGVANGEDGGFVVTSFRSVSRVHEDPVSPVSATSPPLPPLPALSSSTSTFEQDPQQQESIRTSKDYGSNYPRRPALNTRGPATDSSPPSSSRYDFGDRAPSPSTISVEAFRLASARSKSSVSLASMAAAPPDPSSPPLDNDRPKFEPVQRPSSRTSRRASTYSDLHVGGSGTGSDFLPPRPRFAHHSNSSNSSIQSRKSSNHSIGAQTPPIQSDAGRAGVGLTQSESFMSVNSFATAPEPRTAATSPAASRVTSPVRPSPTNSTFPLPSPATTTDSSSALPVRPAAVKRLSSGDSDLRWIASYADSITSSEITTSPVTYKNPSLPFPGSSPPRSRDSVSTPSNKNAISRASFTPSFSVQPPTPNTISDFSGSPAPANASPTASRSQPAQRYPKRASSLIPESTKSALQNIGVGSAPRRQSVGTIPKPTVVKENTKPSSTSRPVASRGWMSDSSDEEEQEALETDSSEGNSDSDDEVPLATIKSRSQTDLSLPPSLVQAENRAKAELEAAAVAKETGVKAAETKLNGSTLGLGLGRRGSNRRSISTLSFSTAALSIPTPAAASTSTPNLPPSSPTRSILQRPNHPRSVSNPNTPYPPSSPVTAAPPVPAIPSRVTDRSSSSSGTGSSSSALLTPHDLSPAASDLGLKSRAGPPHLAKPSVKFDLAALSSPADSTRWNKGRRASAIASSQSNLGSQFSPFGQNFVQHRPTQSLQPFTTPSIVGHRAGSVAPSRSNRPGPQSTLAPSPSSTSLGSSKTAVESHAPGSGNVFDRMKARHKQETVEALKLGSDLNHPSGLVPEQLVDDEDDEDEPLANLPTRGGGSMIGGMDGGSMMSGMMGFQQQHPYGGMGMGMGFGGAYSPLAVAPPGVDPYLYASLPPDQKMSLHQRSQQMMAMMAQAAQAAAESVAGSAMGGYEGSMVGGENGGGAGGRGGPRGNLHGASMSMSNLGSFATQGGPPQAGARLPPFAPSFAMSAPYMHPGMQAHHAHSGSLYQMPGYAGSAIGFSPSMQFGGGSVVGGPASQIGGGGGGARRGNYAPGGRAASMMGVNHR